MFNKAEIAIQLVSTYVVRSKILTLNEFLNLLKTMNIDYEQNCSLKYESLNYEEVQNLLSNLNEKEKIRKDMGVYYTPKDIVKFIINNSVNLYFDKIESNRITSECDDECLRKNLFLSYFEPTSGAGEFLIDVLSVKFSYLKQINSKITPLDVRNIMGTVKGNDINIESITIAKLRVFLLVLHEFGELYIREVIDVIDSMFYNIDFINNCGINEKFDIIVGNPPYVEDSKYGNQTDKYGNIYANIMVNSVKLLKESGILGMIVPISYSSTPRMKKLRNELIAVLPTQFIFSYSDRPSSLFMQVHQKANILLAKKNGKKEIFTNNYRYWYNDERTELFKAEKCVNNPYLETGFIPKLGTDIDISIFKKVFCSKEKSILSIINKGNSFLYVNTRAAFWIKAFLNEHKTASYVKYGCQDDEHKYLLYCILNSSLFWWYWICVSDCWHITNKELGSFKFVKPDTFDSICNAALELETKLEKTKVYIGSKQVEFEYKHKNCLSEVHRIDDLIGSLYNLSEKEIKYIKEFSLKYRTSMKNNSIRIIDLFSGCGGLSLGFEKAGFTITKAVEYDSNIAQNYRYNHSGVDLYVDDIKNLDENDTFSYKEAELIVGGPPCQGFSMAGARNRNGFIDDERNYLFKHYFNIVKRVKPKIFVFENVKGIANIQNGAIFNEILRIFSDKELLEGDSYQIFYKVVRGIEMGIPQKRERMIIIGVLNGDVDVDNLWKETQQEILVEYPSYFDKVTIEDAIGNMPDTSEDGDVANPIAKTEYQKFLASSESRLSNHNTMHHSPKAIERMKKIKNGENYMVLDEEIKSIHSGSYGRLSWEDVAPTITTRFDTPAGGRFIHPIYNRTLTPREAARIQSFPDDFKFVGNKTTICKVIGNAVPPKISYFIAVLCKRILKEGKN